MIARGKRRGSGAFRSGERKHGAAERRDRRLHIGLCRAVNGGIGLRVVTDDPGLSGERDNLVPVKGETVRRCDRVVRPFCQRVEIFTGNRFCTGNDLADLLARQYVHAFDGGTGQDVVELIFEQHLIQRIRFRTARFTGEHVGPFKIMHRFLGASIVPLDVVHGGERTAMEFEIQLAIVQRQCIARFFQPVHECADRHRFDLRQSRHIPFAAQIFQHRVGRTAAAIAKAVCQQLIGGRTLVTDLIDRAFYVLDVGQAVHDV